jgi:hypothetical protein
LSCKFTPSLDPSRESFALPGLNLSLESLAPFGRTCRGLSASITIGEAKSRALLSLFHTNPARRISQTPNWDQKEGHNHLSVRTGPLHHHRGPGYLRTNSSPLGNPGSSDTRTNLAAGLNRTDDGRDNIAGASDIKDGIACSRFPTRSSRVLRTWGLR